MNKMTLPEAIQILLVHQAWRLGADIEMAEPKVITEALDVLLNYHTETTEISDEEIEKAARDYDNAVIYGPPLLHFEQGAFWYREQLKSRVSL